MIETAKTNGHNPQHYISMSLAELPNAKTVDDIDALLPWAIIPETIATRCAAFPTP